jgi:hypothetical protein
LGCCFARAKDSQAGVLEQVDNPHSENVIRTYDGEINRLLLREVKQPLNLP